MGIETRGRPNLSEAPRELREMIAGFEVQHVDAGCSEASIVRLHGPGREGPYLKIARRRSEHSLAREHEVSSWLQGRLPVPRVLYYGRTAEHEYLLLSELPGAVACDERFRADVRQVVSLVAKGLRAIHSIDVKDCPFDRALEHKLKEVGRRVALGLVDVTQFEPEWSHLSAQDVLAKLLAERPDSEDLVFTHGDYCLTNIVIHGTDLSGFIDWGQGGIADRHQDLALAARSLADNWGDEWVGHLFADYDLADIDERKLDYYRLLDELF